MNNHVFSDTVNFSNAKGKSPFSWLLHLARAFSIVLNRNFDNRRYCFVPDVIGIAFSSVQSLNRVRLFVTPWTAASQASLSITNSRNLLKLMSIESVMSSNHLILCRPLLLSLLICPSIMVFSNESVLIRWPKYWSFSFSISPSNELSRLIPLRMDWLDILAV